MRLSTTAALTTLVAMVAAAPLPSPSAEDNLVEAHEEGLLLLVPTLPADSTPEKNGKDLKREVDASVLAVVHPATPVTLYHVTIPPSLHICIPLYPFHSLHALHSVPPSVPSSLLPM